MIRLAAFTRIVSRQLLSQNHTLHYSPVASKILQWQIRNYSPHGKVENVRELIAAQDSDTFGGLSTSGSADDEYVDEGDIEEEEFLKHPPKQSQKLTTRQYGDMIKEHLKYHRIKEALDILEVRMLKEDRVKPENYIYNLLIAGCAKVGYSRKAFDLFLRMRQRALRVTGGTYTSLFNACANTPWPQDGLNKANRLREIMLEKGYDPNAVNYNAMIKAYGRCGDLKTAFQLVDEMTDKNLRIEVDTFNFILQACASDKEFGFRHALLVWHKMLQRRLTPDIYSFNLMLRCCRDTHFGDADSMDEVLQTILLNSGEQNQLQLETSQESLLLKKAKQKDPSSDPTPNLLSIQPHLGNLISLSEVKKPEDKLILLGGFSGFLETMKTFGARPDLKTYTELIEVIPPSTASEKRLLKELKKDEIKCDVRIKH
jgi:pentatricopeptide repeat domain-containing protein 1